MKTWLLRTNDMREVILDIFFLSVAIWMVIGGFNLLYDVIRWIV